MDPCLWKKASKRMPTKKVERGEMYKFIEKQSKKGYIRPSKSLQTASVMERSI